ncbi:MAG: RebB family R body protein [Pseudomonadota bacterium]
MATDSQPAAPDPQSLAFLPALSLQSLYGAIGQALSDAAKNAANAQQQGNVLAQAATTEGISTLFSIDTATLGIAAREELDKAKASLSRGKSSKIGR